MRFRQSEWRTVPDYIDVRLKDGRIPSEADGQAVVLLLHTLNWAGDGAVCDTGTTVAHGDRISFLETDRVEIAFCSDEGIEDWYISPPALENQCQCPNISSARQNEAETEAIGARVVNELSADLPQVQSGHTNAQFRKTLDRTFANYAEFDFIYAPYGYLKVNILGEWVALDFESAHGTAHDVGDVPGWYWVLYNDNPFGVILTVEDTCNNIGYDLVTWDADSSGTLTQNEYYEQYSLVDRIFDNESVSPRVNYEYSYFGVEGLLRKVELGNPSNYLQYNFQTLGGADVLTVTASTGTGAEQASRQARGTFDQGRLRQANIVGGGATRVYEWYNDPTKRYDGDLKSVSDLSGNVLAAFEYDEEGRLIKRTRGSTAGGNLQTVAEFIYTPATGQAQKMEARHYVDATTYQAAVRLFDSRNRVTYLTEYETLASGGTLPTEGQNANTDFSFHTPPRDIEIPDADPFYHQICSFGGQQVVLSRCVEKRWPNSTESLSEYTFYDCDFNVTDRYLAPSGITADPAEPVNHIKQTWARNDGLGGPDWGLWQMTEERNESATAATNYTYDANGFRMRVDQPEVLTGVNTAFRAFETTQYDSRHRVDLMTRNDGKGNTITIDYGYNIYDDRISQTENPGADQIQWLFDVNAFGDEMTRTDPDGYVTEKRYTDAGLIRSMLTYESGNSGPLLKQTEYIYQNGRLHQIKVADHDGSFTVDVLDAWVTTTYGYDDYGRITSRTITPGNYTTTFEYDYQDRLTKIKYPDGIWKKTTRNGRGQIVKVEIGPNPILTSTYKYDLNGNLEKRECEGCPDCAEVTEYEYDRYNRRTVERRVANPQQ
jgi:YD repeat-containing protein